jgi:hypothetical protein
MNAKIYSASDMFAVQKMISIPDLGITGGRDTRNCRPTRLVAFVSLSITYDRY